MRLFLRVLSVLYALGALVHWGNILGFGELSFSAAPLSWKLADSIFAPLDTAAAIGLWKRRPWGIALFVTAACAQLVMYGIFPDSFAFTEEHRQTLRGMLWFHTATLALVAMCGVLARRRTPS